MTRVRPNVELPHLGCATYGRYQNPEARGSRLWKFSIETFDRDFRYYLFAKRRADFFENLLWKRVDRPLEFRRYSPFIFLSRSLNSEDTWSSIRGIASFGMRHLWAIPKSRDEGKRSLKILDRDFRYLFAKRKKGLVFSKISYENASISFWSFVDIPRLFSL